MELAIGAVGAAAIVAALAVVLWPGTDSGREAGGGAGTKQAVPRERPADEPAVNPWEGLCECERAWLRRFFK